MREHGPGDYLIAAPTYPIIDKAAKPEIEKILGRLLKIGIMNLSPLEFRISPLGEQWLWPSKKPDTPTRIIFGHADEPESLEAMTIKDAWLDEAGQKRFKRDSFDTVRDRLSIDRGRCLITSRPYSLGWMKQKLYDPWEASGHNHKQIKVINFDSRMNPAFPVEEYERAKLELPKNVFDMKYRGKFTRPAGLIFDCFDRSLHVRPRQTIPDSWERFVGLDFGGINTAAVFWAKEPCTPVRYWAYREYWPRVNRTAKEHVAALLVGEPKIPVAVGGAGSEDQWRKEFAAAGLSVIEPPIKEVEVGINRMYGHFQRPNEVVIFDDLAYTLEELSTYSRTLDAMGEPTEAIEDKEDFHLVDSMRYFFSHASHSPRRLWVGA